MHKTSAWKLNHILLEWQHRTHYSAKDRASHRRATVLSIAIIALLLFLIMTALYFRLLP